MKPRFAENRVATERQIQQFILQSLQGKKVRCPPPALSMDSHNAARTNSKNLSATGDQSDRSLQARLERAKVCSPKVDTVLEGLNLAQASTASGSQVQLPTELIRKIASASPSVRSAFRLTSRRFADIANSEVKYIRLRALEGLESIEKGIGEKTYPGLVSLDLSEIFCDQAIPIKLFEILSDENCNVNSLDLSRNVLYQDDVERLAEVMCLGKLRSLRLSEAGIGTLEIRELSNALRDAGCRITDLDVSGNYLGRGDVAVLADTLSHENNQLNRLAMRACGITGQGANRLFESLAHRNCRLRILDVSSNAINSIGIMSLGMALCDPKCPLESLDANENRIDDHGVNLLVDEMKQNADSSLRTINLSKNNITTTGLRRLAILLATNPNLEVATDPIDDDDASESRACQSS